MVVVLEIVPDVCIKYRFDRESLQRMVQWGCFNVRVPDQLFNAQDGSLRVHAIVSTVIKTK